MSAGAAALMKLIERPVIDNSAARQRHRHEPPSGVRRRHLSLLILVRSPTGP